MGAPVKLPVTKLQVLPLALRVQFFSAHVWQGIVMAGDVSYLSKTMKLCPVGEAYYYHPDNLKHTLI